MESMVLSKGPCEVCGDYAVCNDIHSSRLVVKKVIHPVTGNPIKMEEKFELQAIVELFGHNKIAGKVSEQSIGGSTFVRVDVPNTTDQPSFTRFLHPNAIYAINPVSAEVALAMAERIRSKPIEIWDAEEVIKRINEKKQLKAVDDGPLGDIDDE